MMPTKYEDIWTAAKGFYKLEPIVADGGELIIYAPHITQVSVMQPIITKIGCHNRDNFLGQWDKFRNRHWCDSAHSTHMRGQGRWDPDMASKTESPSPLRRHTSYTARSTLRVPRRFLPPPRLRQ
jgi:hypothetical protein